VDVVCVIGGGF